jgi:hypothetical protein
MTLATLIATTGTWIAITVLLVVYLLFVGPFLAIGFYAVLRKDSGALDRAVADVGRFIELRERAQAELAATGSLDRFVALKDEARKHLWRSASERVRPQRPSGRV